MRRYKVVPEEVLINEESEVLGVSQVSNTNTSQVSSPNTLSQRSQLTDGTDNGKWCIAGIYCRDYYLWFHG